MVVDAVLEESDIVDTVTAGLPVHLNAPLTSSGKDRRRYGMYIATSTPSTTTSATAITTAANTATVAVVEDVWTATVTATHMVAEKVDMVASMLSSIGTSPSPVEDAAAALSGQAAEAGEDSTTSGQLKPLPLSSATATTAVHPSALMFTGSETSEALDSRASLGASSIMSTPAATPDGHSLATQPSEDEGEEDDDANYVDEDDDDDDESEASLERIARARATSMAGLNGTHRSQHASAVVTALHRCCTSPEPADMSAGSANGTVASIIAAADSDGSARSTRKRVSIQPQPTRVIPARSYSDDGANGRARSPSAISASRVGAGRSAARNRHSMMLAGRTTAGGNSKRSSMLHMPAMLDADPDASSASVRLMKRRSLTRRATYNVGGVMGRSATAIGSGSSGRPSSGIFDNAHPAMSTDSRNHDLQNWEAAKQQLRARKTMRRKRSLGPAGASATTAGEKPVIGNPIKEGHANYVLMYNMLTGIRVAVSRCTAKPFRALVDADFVAAHKLAFDITGSEMTPSSKYDFKFKDYAPWVFRHIRRKFGVSSSDYLVSLTSRYILSELGSPGKSGSFFYFSQDYRFIIKTIHHAEHKFLRKILRHYWEHVEQNPHTLISRFFGLHRVKMPHGRKIHFVVMSNINPPNRDIHETYDLKGSTVGRMLSDDDRAKQSQLPMKDLNWLQRGRRLEFGPQKRDMLVHQLERDVSMLSRLRIMDYSLLVGTHDMSRGNFENIRQAQLSVFQPGRDRAGVAGAANTAAASTAAANNTATTIAAAATMTTTATATTTATTTTTSLTAAAATAATATAGNGGHQQKVNALRNAVGSSDPIAFDPHAQPLNLPDDTTFDERRLCVFQQDEGGFQATDDADHPVNLIYYLGIIDILTPYSTTKRLEHFFKSIGHDRNGISAVRPSLYGRRFLNFMINAIRSAGEGGNPAEAAASPVPFNGGGGASMQRRDSIRRKRMSRVHTS